MNRPAAVAGPAAAGAAVVLALAACGSSSQTAGPAAPPAVDNSVGATGTSTGPASSANAPTAALAAVDTTLGQVLATRGHVVYVLESGGTDVPCTGSCASIWPPVTNGGQIVTAGGHPVYTYVADNGPGQLTGQGVQSFGGVWMAVRPDGTPIRTTPSSRNPGVGGGYGY